VREESHLDAMREAIRGDFDRLAERRGEQDLMRTAEPAAGAVAWEVEAVRDREPLAEPEPAEPQRRPWLARFFAPE